MRNNLVKQVVIFLVVLSLIIVAISAKEDLQQSNVKTNNGGRFIESEGWEEDIRLTYT